MYSPDVSQRKPPPSNFRALVKTTVLAGMLSPVENVSVANSTCKTASCRMRRISTAAQRPHLGDSLWTAKIRYQDCMKRLVLCGHRSSGHVSERGEGYVLSQDKSMP